MATITTDTFLDGGTARTAGESWTINGPVFTIRTDSRWHANAPASMTGSIGSVSISTTLGGSFVIDATKVRWMPFNSGSGTVPAIGTTITQGGVSGYLLGVWSSLTAAPTAVGAAMPTTGFLKFREVTGGNYSAGALTGISASATSPDVLGWIEVVSDTASTFTIPRRGSFISDGGWFDLGTTNGTAGQQIQIPTNGGGAATVNPAVWIETSPGSGQYEQYPGFTSTYFNTTNLSTDARSKFVFLDTNGAIRIGGDGTNTIGFLPASGCKIRIPNIFLRECATASRAVNSTPNNTLTNRPEFATTSAGVINMKYTSGGWYLFFTSAYSINIENCATFDQLNFRNNVTPVNIDNLCVSALGANICLNVLNTTIGGTIKNSKFFRGNATAQGHAVSFTSAMNFVLDNIHCGIVNYARLSTRVSLSLCMNFTIKNMYAYQTYLEPVNSTNISIEDYDYTDRILGTTNATTPFSAFGCQGTNVSLNRMTLGLKGTISDVHPYNNLFLVLNSSQVTIRNCGSFASPIGGTTNAPANVFVDGGNNSNVRIQNVFCRSVRTGLMTSNNTSDKVTFERVTCNTGNLLMSSLNSYMKGLRGGNIITTAQASVYGSHWGDMFISDNAGLLFLMFNEPTSLSMDQYEQVSLGSGAGFTSNQSLVMPNLTDEVIFTMNYYALGHRYFTNFAPDLIGTNTGNFAVSYQLDRNNGSGFNGTWKTLNATNLSGEGLTALDNGFKFKIRVKVSVAAADNALQLIRVYLSTQTANQSAASYPLDYATIKLNGLTANSRVQLFDTTNNVELYNQIVSGTSLTYSTPYTADFNCRVRVMYQSGIVAKEFVEFTESVSISGVTRTVQQVDDSVYSANAVDGSLVSGITINDTLLLVETNTGSLTWQQIYAYETYWLYTQAGIRDEGRFIEAIDQANYKLFGFKIKNVSSPAVPLIITGGYAVDGNTGTTLAIIDSTGGTIISAPPHVVAFSTSGGGGASAADIWAYSSRTLTTTIPTAAQNASAVRTELATELGRIDVATSTRLATSGYTEAPTASQNASAVRTELSTELGRIDASVSSRLPTASYTTPPTAASIRNEIDTNSTKLDVAVSTRNAIAPDNAGVAAIKAKTDNLPSDPASNTQVNTRLASSSYVAPDNASIAAVKSKTDNLPAAPASEGSVLSVGASVDNLPTLSEIESSTVLAKQSTVEGVKKNTDLIPATV